MAFELARFVNLDVGMVSQDLQNIYAWVLAEKSSGAALSLRWIDNQRLKVELPRHLKGRGWVTKPRGPKEHLEQGAKGCAR